MLCFKLWVCDCEDGCKDRDLEPLTPDTHSHFRNHVSNFISHLLPQNQRMSDLDPPALNFRGRIQKTISRIQNRHPEADAKGDKTSRSGSAEAQKSGGKLGKCYVLG